MLYRPEFDDSHDLCRHDSLGPPRGVANGILISLVLWALLALTTGTIIALLG